MGCQHDWRKAEWHGSGCEVHKISFCRLCEELEVERIYPTKTGPNKETLRAVIRFFRNKTVKISSLEQLKRNRLYSPEELAAEAGIDPRTAPRALKMLDESKLEFNGKVSSIPYNGRAYFRDDPADFFKVRRASINFTCFCNDRLDINNHVEGFWCKGCGRYYEPIGNPTQAPFDYVVTGRRVSCRSRSCNEMFYASTSITSCPKCHHIYVLCGYALTECNYCPSSYLLETSATTTCHNSGRSFYVCKCGHQKDIAHTGTDKILVCEKCGLPYSKCTCGNAESWELDLLFRICTKCKQTWHRLPQCGNCGKTLGQSEKHLALICGNCNASYGSFKLYAKREWKAICTNCLKDFVIMPEIARYGVAKQACPHCNYPNEFKLRELLLYGIIPKGPYRKMCDKCGNESNFTLTKVGIHDLATYGYTLIECGNNNCLDEFLIIVNRHRIRVELNELINHVDIASAAPPLFRLTACSTANDRTQANITSLTWL